jgi:hypothetical protein
MIRFLFWNINKKPLAPTIRNLVVRHDVDILMLAESNIPSGSLLRTINDGTSRPFLLPFTLLTSISVYTRYSARFVKAIEEDDGTRLSIRRLVLPSGVDLLFAVVHLPSKLRWSESSQSQFCPRVADRIAKAESDVGHSRTLVVGDFNMNPFEAGMVSSYGFHAVMCRHIAAKSHRKVVGERRAFYYNPMWSLMGDASRGPSGTYYYHRSEPVCYFWNTFDQVLLRPSLLSYFRNEDLQIITSDGVTDFTTRHNRPNAQKVSDHLPLLFGLDLQ